MLNINKIHQILISYYYLINKDELILYNKKKNFNPLYDYNSSVCQNYMKDYLFCDCKYSAFIFCRSSGKGT